MSRPDRSKQALNAAVETHIRTELTSQADAARALATREDDPS